MKSFIFILCLSSLASAARIKDIAMLKGARSNQLFGYGLVIGLPGTGDKSNELTENSMGLVLKGLGIDIKKQKKDLRLRCLILTTCQ